VEHRSLGTSGPRLSVLGFGAWVTGSDTASELPDAAGLRRAITAAIDAGYTWFDTAEIYARGGSEELLGEVLRPIRDRVLIVTKVAPSGAGSGMRPGEIARAIRESLGRLGVDHVDLYLLHWHDPSVPLEETWGAMAQLVEQGLSRYVGVSNFGYDLIARCQAVAPVHAVENQLSMLHRNGEELAARLSMEGVAFLAYGALAFGLLSGRVTPETILHPSDWRAGSFARYESNYYQELFARGRIESSYVFARGIAAIAADADLPASGVALRWVLERPGVSAAVVGSTDLEHVATNAQAGDLRLDEKTSRRIDELVSAHRTVAEETATAASARARG
jgi:aryl-alcohol dehydrogenase-like predicted oxidoreductase